MVYTFSFSKVLLVAFYYQEMASAKDETLARTATPLCDSGGDLGFQHRGFEQRGRRRRPPCRVVRGNPPPQNFKISSPRKRDFRHSEAKSACFNISFFKVKMPFFLHQNITKLSRNDANLHL